MNLFNLWILLQVWCHLAPLAAAETPEPNPSPSTDPAPSPAADPQPDPAPAFIPEPRSVLFLPAVPLAMAWIGSIGGLLGIISFSDNYMQKLVGAFSGKASGPDRPPAKHDTAWFKDFEKYHRKILDTHWKPRVAPDKKGDASWKIGIQVGLDGTGLEVSVIPVSVRLSNSAVRKG